MNQANKRRIVLIDHRFQLRMTAGFITLQIFLTAVFAFGLYLFIDSDIHADLASAHASYQSLSRMLLPIFVILAVFSVTLSVVLITAFVVLLSHRIAGPMFRIRAVLDALAERRFNAITHIRQHDQLGELASSLERALQAIKADVLSMQQSAGRLRECLHKDDRAAAADEVTRIEGMLNAWKEE